MLADIRAGLIDAVVVLRVDRLVRDEEKRNDARDFGRFAKQHDLKFATNGGTIAMKTAAGWKRFMSEALEAEYEGGVKSERLLEKHQELARDGVAVGGERPYGYEGRITQEVSDGRVLVLNRDRAFTAIVPEEAARAREAAGRVLAGEPLRAVCRDWNARGIPGPSGGKWTVNTLKRILVNPRIAGHRTHHGVITKRNAWPAILDDVTHARLVAKLTDPARFSGGRRAGRSYLLSGDRHEQLATCGRCEARMTGARDPKGVRVYRCQGCRNNVRPAEPVDELIRDAVFYVYDTEAFRRQVPDDARQAKLVDMLQAFAAHTEQLRDALADGTIEPDDFAHAKRRIEANERQTRYELDQLCQPESAAAAFPQRGKELRDAWANNGIEWRHALIKSVIRRVVILRAGKGSTGAGPGRPGRFDPTKIKVVWDEETVDLDKVNGLDLTT
jgi:site-specific DNA recombinase